MHAESHQGTWFHPHGKRYCVLQDFWHVPKTKIGLSGKPGVLDNCLGLSYLTYIIHLTSQGQCGKPNEI